MYSHNIRSTVLYFLCICYSQDKVNFKEKEWTFKGHQKCHIFCYCRLLSWVVEAGINTKTNLSNI